MLLLTGTLPGVDCVVSCGVMVASGVGCMLGCGGVAVGNGRYKQAHDRHTHIIRFVHKVDVT